MFFVLYNHENQQRKGEKSTCSTFNCTAIEWIFEFASTSASAFSFSESSKKSGRCISSICFGFCGAGVSIRENGKEIDGSGGEKGLRTPLCTQTLHVFICLH